MYSMLHDHQPDTRNNYQLIGMQEVPSHMFSSPQPARRKKGWSGEDVAVRYLHMQYLQQTDSVNKGLCFVKPVETLLEENKKSDCQLMKSILAI